LKLLKFKTGVRDLSSQRLSLSITNIEVEALLRAAVAFSSPVAKEPKAKVANAFLHEKLIEVKHLPNRKECL